MVRVLVPARLRPPGTCRYDLPPLTLPALVWCFDSTQPRAGSPPGRWPISQRAVRPRLRNRRLLLRESLAFSVLQYFRQRSPHTCGPTSEARISTFGSSSWAAAAYLDAEESSRRIVGYRDLCILKAAFDEDTESQEVRVA